MTTQNAVLTIEELRRLAGDLDDETLTEILALDPSVEEIEEAVMWANREGDIPGKSGHPLDGKAAAIFDILTAGEEDEPPRR